MAGTVTWRIWYAAVSPLRWCVEWLQWAIFWRRYSRIRRGLQKAEGKAFTDAARELIASAERIEVLSLGEFIESDPEAFDRWRIIGRTVVEDEAMRKLLADRLLIANEASGRGLKCIDGEYGIRINARGLTLNVMICFACGNAWITGSAEAAGMGNVCWTPLGYLLNRVLRRANVPLPQPGLSHAAE